MTTPPCASSKSAGPRPSSRTRRTPSITSRRHARRAALAGRRPPAWRRGRPLRRRDANKDVRGTLTKSRVVGADERVAYCRERRVSSVLSGKWSEGGKGGERGPGVGPAGRGAGGPTGGVF